jgi:hypothetical protein
MFSTRSLSSSLAVSGGADEREPQAREVADHRDIEPCDVRRDWGADARAVRVEVVREARVGYPAGETRLTVGLYLDDVGDGDGYRREPEQGHGRV